MKIKVPAFLLFFSAAVASCGSPAISSEPTTQNKVSAVSDSGAGNANLTYAANTETAAKAAGEPKTIREFFMQLPEKYFVLEGCQGDREKDCNKAKLDYLKTFTEVEDTANGYFKGGCDGAQTCIEMAIFKRPDGTYLAGVSTFAEMMNDNYFIDYDGGKWTDVSASVVPQFSKKNMYELPRVGTVVKVFAKKIIEKGDDYEASEKGEKLYDLEWKDGKFTVKK